MNRRNAPSRYPACRREPVPACRVTLMALAWLTIVATSGCGDFEKTPFGKHMTQDQKAEAKQNWNAVRGDVKLQIVRQQLDAGRLDEAQKILETVLSTSPQDARAYVLATRLRLEQGRMADARSAIVMAQQLAPTDGEVQYYGGVVAQRYGDLNAALAAYEAAATASSNNAAYLLAWAETLSAIGRPGDALALIESRLNDFDDNVPLRVLAARAARQLGLKAPAVQYLREALLLARDDALLASFAAETFVWAGAWDEAFDVLHPMVAKADAPASARYLLAEACLACNKPAAALEAVAPLTKETDADAVALLLAARASLATSRLDEAVAYADRARRLAADSADVRLLCAYLAMRRNRPDEALAEIDHALRLGADPVAPLCLKGQTHERTGKTNEAREAYLAALAANPDAAAPQRLLQRLNERVGVAPTAASVSTAALANDAEPCTETGVTP